VENAPTSSQQSPAATASQIHDTAGLSGEASQMHIDPEIAGKLDKYSLEAIVEWKIARFLDQIGTYYPENLHGLIMKKVEKPLVSQILKRTGGNQVHASRILGINRNTLRKKMKIYGLAN